MPQTPQGRLAEIEARRASGEEARRREIMDAMLCVAGEVGYRKATVAAVMARCGGSRSPFYRHFPNRDSCYASAYEEAIEGLCAELTGKANEDGGCAECIERALTKLGRLLTDSPQKARGILVEVHVAHGPALVRHQEVVERLSHAIQRACRETDASRHSPPPLTAEFMVRAVESAATSTLLSGEPERFEQAIPELTEMVVGAF
jgi:AcrR family transcriptional regulator